MGLVLPPKLWKTRVLFALDLIGRLGGYFLKASAVSFGACFGILLFAKWMGW
jgi:hypothetical protein